MNELANVSKVFNFFEGEGFRRVFVRISFKIWKPCAFVITIPDHSTAWTNLYPDQSWQPDIAWPTHTDRSATEQRSSVVSTFITDR